MNLQPMIDNLPMILAALGFVLWAWAQLTAAKAKANPAKDAWDDRADRAAWASRMYSQAIDWLVEAGAQKWSGAQKLSELNARVKGFEEQWLAGNYIEALTNLSGFYQDAKAKVEKVAKVSLPFAIHPAQRISPKPSPEPSGVPDSMENAVAVESSDGPGHGEVTK